jgi:hypothetical protein
MDDDYDIDDWGYMGVRMMQPNNQFTAGIMRVMVSRADDKREQNPTTTRGISPLPPCTIRGPSVASA